MNDLDRNRLARGIFMVGYNRATMDGMPPMTGAQAETFVTAIDEFLGALLPADSPPRVIALAREHAPWYKPPG